MSIHAPTTKERERALIRSHAEKELAHAIALIRLDDPSRDRDIADALRKVAKRFDALAEGER